jgi:hypothetical protein
MGGETVQKYGSRRVSEERSRDVASRRGVMLKMDGCRKFNVQCSMLEKFERAKVRSN